MSQAMSKGHWMEECGTWIIRQTSSHGIASKVSKVLLLIAIQVNFNSSGTNDNLQCESGLARSIVFTGIISNRHHLQHFNPRIHTIISYLLCIYIYILS